MVRTSYNLSIKAQENKTKKPPSGKEGTRELAPFHLKRKKKVISLEILKTQPIFPVVCAQIPTALGAQENLNRMQRVSVLVMHPGAQREQTQILLEVCHLNEGLKVLPQIKSQGKRATHKQKL